MLTGGSKLNVTFLDVSNANSRSFLSMLGVSNPSLEQFYGKWLKPLLILSNFDLSHHVFNILQTLMTSYRALPSSVIQYLRQSPWLPNVKSQLALPNALYSTKGYQLDDLFPQSDVRLLRSDFEAVADLKCLKFWGLKLTLDPTTFESFVNSVVEKSSRGILPPPINSIEYFITVVFIDIDEAVSFATRLVSYYSSMTEASKEFHQRMSRIRWLPALQSAPISTILPLAWHPTHSSDKRRLVSAEESYPVGDANLLVGGVAPIVDVDSSFPLRPFFKTLTVSDIIANLYVCVLAVKRTDARTISREEYRLFKAFAVMYTALKDRAAGLALEELKQGGDIDWIYVGEGLFAPPKKICSTSIRDLDLKPLYFNIPSAYDEEYVVSSKFNMFITCHYL